ncbi:terminase small subunit [Ignavigranum ruoffiae]|uniref:terminase small subunit n=1 Tax=Ignavigranum ruoffiae TaxID=89093 RepID=UPI0023568DFB|nr:terminase small subunit [Ignavigranum ruoffiae]
MKLTIKQKKFADEYIISGNATQSAINAGYSKNTARAIGAENLTKPNVRQYIDERLKDIDSEKTADQKEVMQYLTRVMRGEETDTEMINVGDFEQQLVEVPVKTIQRIKAAELIGKRYSLWTDRIDASVNSSISLTVGDYDED